ncbi:MacS family sensor histidine kinase [Williamsia sterculiae]|uniref:Histidine kinase-, DNA gyrase B-, and HSP90-like ATPase n=1 Tax=Williamsia sterculiae TaxID=1344003 RepID=A0A1N7CCZ0_9NOCA|nr:DUF5931 domain-containing protein [Williamsia sterculiae]SIR61363.1 Histidine kinase-, DNA gyrase B-, and HSP90-like ATPase [Williamsia sterculiae]
MVRGSSVAAPEMPWDDDPVGPLWRAAQGFRVLSYVYALGFHIIVTDDLERPALGWVLFGVLTVWTAVCAVGYLQGFARRTGWVWTEVGAAAMLMISTKLVASDHWALDNQSWPTTLWATNAVISVAILRGVWPGMAAGVLISVASLVAKGPLAVNWDYLNAGRNAAWVIEIGVGMAIGAAATTARRAHEAHRRAARLAAATEERERLSRQVHDGVLQVLALIARRGRELGGPTTHLADLAAEQEGVLRRLLAADATTTTNHGADLDLVAAIRRHQGVTVSVSAPATAVVLPAPLVTEIDAAVTNALDNVARHAGTGAQAFVLVEDLPGSVVITVRDDGVGIAPGRLHAAAADGRLGVSTSIVGRVEALGGRAVLDTAPGQGTEWEFTIPLVR